MRRATTFGKVLLAVFGIWSWLPSHLEAAGNLYEASENSENIYEFTPSDSQSTFASGLNDPIGLAFDSSGNLFRDGRLL